MKKDFLSNLPEDERNKRIINASYATLEAIVDINNIILNGDSNTLNGCKDIIDEIKRKVRSADKKIYNYLLYDAGTSYNDDAGRRK